MNNKGTLPQGEVLLFLANRSKLSKESIAKMLGINPSYLSRLFKSQLLTTNIKNKASAIFGVSVDYFDLGETQRDETGAANEVSEPAMPYTPSFDRRSQMKSILKIMQEKHESHAKEMQRFFVLLAEMAE